MNILLLKSFLRIILNKWDFLTDLFLTKSDGIIHTKQKNDLLDLCIKFGKVYFDCTERFAFYLDEVAKVSLDKIFLMENNIGLLSETNFFDKWSKKLSSSVEDIVEKKKKNLILISSPYKKN